MSHKKESYKVTLSVYWYMLNCKQYLDCRDSQYLEDCTNCSHCFGCSSIHGKQYWIYNKPYDKTAYFIEIEKIQKEHIKSRNKLTSIKKNLVQINVENSIGNYIYDSKNVLFSFDIFESEEVKYSSDMTYAKNIMDVDFFGVHLQNALDSAIIGINASRIRFCIECWSDVENIFYCFGCVNATKDCFACVGLRNKQYCILNKQYTKEEYEVLVPQIIEKMRADGEWGEFFPATISPFGYNETVAQEYFPLSRDEATKDGVFNWSDYVAPFPKVEKIIPASRLPDSIVDIPDDILNWAIECEVTQKPFRIIKQELEFYRKHNLPIPRRHPDQRHLDRMALRNPRKLFERKCDKCSIDMITTYAPERPETVYCEKCYLEII